MSPLLWYRLRRLDRLHRRWEHAQECFETAWTGLDMDDWERVAMRLDEKIRRLEDKIGRS